jgi:hypothetical protein
MVTGKVTQFIFCHKGRTRATTLTIGTDVVLFFTGILHGTITWNTWDYVITGTSVACDVCPCALSISYIHTHTEMLRRLGKPASLTNHVQEEEAIQ